MSQMTLGANGNFVWPYGVTGPIQVEVWGPGGGGGGSANATYGGAGGGGGAYASFNISNGVAGNSYAFVVGQGGAGGANNANGANGGHVSSFANNNGGNTSVLISAAVGVGGVWGMGNANEVPGNGGAANTSTGITGYAGGAGANGNATVGGGGGSSGSESGTGTAATGNAAGTSTNADSGNGGNGGAANANGANGTIPGGGGGGAGANAAGATNTGGGGANGQIRITVPNIYLGNAPTQTLAGSQYRRAKVPLFNLTSGANNTVPHGLPSTPVSAVYVAEGSSAGGIVEVKAPDGNNLYLYPTTVTNGWAIVEF
jgi:hypothetical protein